MTVARICSHVRSTWCVRNSPRTPRGSLWVTGVPKLPLESSWLDHKKQSSEWGVRSPSPSWGVLWSPTDRTQSRCQPLGNKSDIQAPLLTNWVTFSHFLCLSEPQFPCLSSGEAALPGSDPVLLSWPPKGGPTWFLLLSQHLPSLQWHIDLIVCLFPLSLPSPSPRSKL